MLNRVTQQAQLLSSLGALSVLLGCGDRTSSPQPPAPPQAQIETTPRPKSHTTIELPIITNSTAPSPELSDEAKRERLSRFATSAPGDGTALINAPRILPRGELIAGERISLSGKVIAAEQPIKEAANITTEDSIIYMMGGTAGSVGDISGEVATSGIKKLLLNTGSESVSSLRCQKFNHSGAIIYILRGRISPLRTGPLDDKGHVIAMSLSQGLKFCKEHGWQVD